MADLSGSGGIASLIERVLSVLVAEARPETEYEKAVWVRVATEVRSRLLAEMRATGLIFNCPRLDEDKCMYFSKAGL